MKRISTILLTLSLILTSTSAYSEESQNNVIAAEVGNASKDEFLNFIDEPITGIHAGNLYRKLYASFEEIEDGVRAYPETYGGSWIDGEFLIIALTDTDKTVIAYYDGILEHDDSVKYVSCKYSVDTLKELGENVVNQYENDYTFYGYYPDYINNTVVVEVMDEEQCEALNSEIAQISKAYNINKTNCLVSNSDVSMNDFPDIIKFEVGEPINLDSTKVIGGMKTTDVNGNRSVGVCGTITINDKNYEGFVTAGHETELNNEFTINGSTYGIVYACRYIDDQNGDFAIVKKTSSDFTNTNDIFGSSSSLYRHITGYDLTVGVNEKVYKYGFKGGYAYGTVVSVDYTSKVNNVSIKGLVKCSITKGSAVNGDSGGPCYHYAQGTTSGTNFNFVGVHNGHVGTEYMFFTPYDCFDSYFTPKTS